MNLLVEYCSRRKTKFVLPTNEGVCFFNEYNRPAVVCTTSITPKAATICGKCVGKDSLITAELYMPNRGGIMLTSHEHIHPDMDLIKYIQNKGISDPQPPYIKNGKDIELWLWKFFLFHSRLRHSSKWKDKNLEDPYEQMTYCALHYPDTFGKYYTLYQTLIVGRKYLFFGES